MSREVSRIQSREVSRSQSRGLVRQVEIDTEADVALAKIDAITGGTGYGLGAVAKVGQLEGSLAEMMPGVQGRLNFLANRHVLGVGEILDDLQTKVRRK
jgi:hypothetical protein